MIKSKHYITMITLALTLGLSISNIAIAEQPTSANNNAKQSTSSRPAAHDNSEYCPAVKNLYKKDQLWWAPGSWRSYSQSFVDEIKGFIGAQWVGVNLGHIICLYRGSEAFTFPISLQRTSLVKPPTSPNWKKRPNGYLVCISSNRFDCTFPPRKKQKSVDVKQLLHSIKPS